MFNACIPRPSSYLLLGLEYVLLGAYGGSPKISGTILGDPVWDSELRALGGSWEVIFQTWCFRGGVPDLASRFGNFLCYLMGNKLKGLRV